LASSTIFRRIDLFQLVERRARAERSHAFAPDDDDSARRMLAHRGNAARDIIQKDRGERIALRVVERNSGDAVGNGAGHGTRAERLHS
jgi:hypothetical protein